MKYWIAEGLKSLFKNSGERIVKNNVDSYVVVYPEDRVTGHSFISFRRDPRLIEVFKLDIGEKIEQVKVR